MTLHEAKNLSLPPSHQQYNTQRPSSSSSHNGPGSRPGTAGNSSAAHHGHQRNISKLFRTYCVIEFDKTQVIVNANSGTLDSPMFSGYSTQYKFDVSRDTELSLGIYMKNPGSGNRDEDLFLGSCRVNPRFEEPTPPHTGKKGREQPPPAPGMSGVDWIQLSSSTGSVKLGIEYRRNQDMPLTIDDFELLKVVGKGSFGKVMQVK